MARIKGGLNAKKRHNRTLKLAKGAIVFWIAASALSFILALFVAKKSHA